MKSKIIARDAVIDEHLLDRMGQDFRFDHVKGLTEWLKNSVDAYLRADKAPTEAVVILRILTNKSRATPKELQVIDFVGMTHDDIIHAFQRWGDPNAAGRKKKKVYGGHGNGGKFYMRQMFNDSTFITYKNGFVSCFGFDDNLRYGFVEGLENKKMSLKEAAKLADLDGLDIPASTYDDLLEGRTGFTVVRGEGLKNAKTKNSTLSILGRLRNHPQSRRLLERYQIYYTVDDASTIVRLQPDEIAPKEGFESEYHFEIPETLATAYEEVSMHKDGFDRGHLIVRTSNEPLDAVADQASLNSIDILGVLGCLASYRMTELGAIAHAAQADFLYGECFCPLLEDPEEDCVKNDREKLVDNERSSALLSWIGRCVDDVASKLAVHDETTKQDQDLKQSSAFNNLLNNWKNKFMNKLYAEVFSGDGVGPGTGGEGGGGEPGDGQGGSKGGKGSKGEDDRDEGGGSGDVPSKGQRFPLVLLSDFDNDPLQPDAGVKVSCDPRHPPVYQRFEDVEHGIYWINTNAPFAAELLKKFGAESSRWRDYLFQRYVEIIVKQAIHHTAKVQTEFTPDQVDVLLDRIHRSVYAEAAVSLRGFLIDDTPTSGLEN